MTATVNGERIEGKLAAMVLGLMSLRSRIEATDTGVFSFHFSARGAVRPALEERFPQVGDDQSPRQIA